MEPKSVLTDRQQQLLDWIINAFVDTAEPIASGFLVQMHNLTWSPATIRNEMAVLEHAGYITHPHTSAGRIPTEQGWRHFLTHTNTKSALSTKEKDALKRVAKKNPDHTLRTKDLAKMLAELSHQTVIIAFTPHDIYYTGISNLMRHPEFHDVDLLGEMTALVDHCEKVMEDLFPKVSEEPTVLLGSENPFGGAAGSVIAKWRKKAQKAQGIFCILGPMRMNYPENLARMRLTQDLLT